MKYLTNIDLNKNQLLNVVSHKLATPPASPVEGQEYYDTAQHAKFYYNGSSWIQSDGLGATMTGSDIIFAINSSTSKIDDDNLSTGVNNAITKAHDSHSISDVTGLTNALDGKVDDSQVLTNVPANAKFTDTTYDLFTTTKDGLVPKTTTSNTSDYLRRDGSWSTPPDTKYTLPVAGISLGGVKSGTDITVDASGNVSVNDNSHDHTVANITGLQTELDGKETPAGATAKASVAENNAKSYTDTKLSDLIGSAPEALDTLHELATALGNDPNFATTLLDSLAEKTKKYSQAVGNGALTSFVLTHNLNSREVVVMIRETASPYAQVITDVEMTTVNTVTVKFAVAPTSNQYTVTIIG